MQSPPGRGGLFAAGPGRQAAAGGSVDQKPGRQPGQQLQRGGVRNCHLAFLAAAAAARSLAGQQSARALAPHLGIAAVVGPQISLDDGTPFAAAQVQHGGGSKEAAFDFHAHGRSPGTNGDSTSTVGMLACKNA